MDGVRADLKQYLISWLDNYWPGNTQIEFEILVLLWLVLFTVLLHLFLHGVMSKLSKKLTGKIGQQWYRLLVSQKLFRRAVYVFQGVVLNVQSSLWLDESSILLHFIQTAADQWILLFSLLAFFSLLDFFQALVHSKSHKMNFPLRGLVQTVKLIASIFVGVLAISILMGKSPVILLSGLGALSAVMMLLFKDPILGLVAGIQLSANDMLAIDDWLEMPKYGADGDVIDIGLTTVKVRNFDKTITTVPTYALISDSFINWRGMSDSGGRRIKRRVLIDTSSIHFLDDVQLQELSKAKLLGEYLDQKIKAIEGFNNQLQADMTVPINGRRLTNIGTLRNYLVSYLKAHSSIHKDMTLMVRQLESSSEGLPLEIYAFTNTTNWAEYEGIQADIFDHLFAVLPAFGLRAHESPTGHDIRALQAPREQVRAAIAATKPV